MKSIYFYLLGLFFFIALKASAQDYILIPENFYLHKGDELKIHQVNASQFIKEGELGFDPSKIDRLDPGKTQDIKATLVVPEKTIAGDYVTKFTVRNNSANADATFRMTVTTSLLSGWIGILIIFLALAIVYYLIRKYGRR